MKDYSGRCGIKLEDHVSLDNLCDGGLSCKRDCEPTKTQCKNCYCGKCEHGKCRK